MRYLLAILLSCSCFSAEIVQQPKGSIRYNSPLDASNYQTAFVDTNGLVGWWPLDTTNGGVALDLSGNGYNGVLTNSYKLTNAMAGNGLTGTNQLCYAPYAVSNLISGRVAATICAWSYNQSGFGFNNPANPVGNRFSVLTSGGRAYFQCETNSTGSYPNCAVPTNAWVHLAFIVSTNTTIAYTNGVAATLTSGGAASSTNLSRSLQQFQMCGITGQNSTCDDVRLYNRALSAAEIGQIYTNGVRYHKP